MFPLIAVLGAFGFGYAWYRHTRSAAASSDATSSGAGDTTSPATGDAGMPGTLSTLRYIPGSSEMIDLFTQAAMQGGLPTFWAGDDSLAQIVKHESNGWVGIPNLQFGDYSSTKHVNDWPIVWGKIKDGTWRDLIDQSKVGPAGPSSATGLGQLTISNIPKYYPSGADGIGIALEEAIGMLKYIEDRYGDPDAAWAFWQAHNWY